MKLSKFFNLNLLNFIFLISGIVFWILIADQNLVTNTCIELKTFLKYIGIAWVVLIFLSWLVCKVSKLHMTFKSHILFNLIFTLSLLLFVFLKTNMVFHSEVKEHVTLPVIETELGGTYRHKNRAKYVIVAMKNWKQEVLVDPEVDLMRARKVEISIAKGFWGLDVLLERKVLY